MKSTELNINRRVYVSFLEHRQPIVDYFSLGFAIESFHWMCAPPAQMEANVIVSLIFIMLCVCVRASVRLFVLGCLLLSYILMCQYNLCYGATKAQLHSNILNDFAAIANILSFILCEMCACASVCHLDNGNCYSPSWQIRSTTEEIDLTFPLHKIRPHAQS